MAVAQVRSPLPKTRARVGQGWLGLASVIALTAGLAAFRLAFVLAGIDPDSDAYGHHTIARQILVSPRDLSVHWVWLPLFHYLQAGAIALGATLQTVRVVNVLLSAAVPLLLYGVLQIHRRAADDARRDPWAGAWDPTPELAASICALSPIAMQMGTTGQTEPLFSLLTMGVVYALARADETSRTGRSHDSLRSSIPLAVAASCATLAVLLRYEAWPIPCAVAAWWVLSRFTHTTSRSASTLWVVVTPLAAILAWAAIRHYAEGGRWFSFLRETREFANGALHTRSSLEGGTQKLLRDALYYAVDVPYRCIGFPLFLAPFGVARTLRREGARFSLVFVAILAFLTLIWILRSSLGLDRHFVVLVPFYATLIANGVVVVAEWLALLVRRWVEGYRHAFLAPAAARAAVICGLGCFALLSSAVLLRRWMTDWRHASEEIWPDRRDVAAYLRTIPPDATVFCDEPTVEVLSELDRRRIDRRSLDDPRAPEWLASAVASGRSVYVATWMVKANRLQLERHAQAVHRPPGWWKDDEGLVVIRLGPASQ